MGAVRDVNKFTNYSYIADAYWYTGSDYGTTYYVKSPEGKIATWFAAPNSEAGSSEATLKAVKETLEEHGTAGDVIEITSAEYSQEMFTMAKNALAIAAFVDAGDLTIQKMVEGKENDDTSFDFSVVFTRENGMLLNGVYDVKYPDGTVAAKKLVDGKIEFSLKSGESITIKDMLPGTNYVVTEKKNANYKASYTNTVGTISAGASAQVVTFTNTYVEDGANAAETKDKSKTATNLDRNFDSEVTLSLPSSSYKKDLDIALVLDGSTSTDEKALAEQAAELLEELLEIENLNVKVSLTIYGGARPVLLSTELMDISNDEYLQFLMKEIQNEAYEEMLGRSGSNLQAGIEYAEKILKEDALVSKENKYLVVLTDGAARMWYEDGVAVAQTYLANDKEVYWNSNEDWMARVNAGTTPRSFAEVWAAGQSGTGVIDRYAMTEAQKDAVSKPKENPGVARWDTVKTDPDYYTTYEAATYFAAESIVHAKKEANVIMVTYPYHNETPHGVYIESFKAWLAEQAGIIRYHRDDDTPATDVFADVKDELLQVVGAGSKVVDVIGYGTYADDTDYDFEFVNSVDKLTLTVGGKVFEKTQIYETAYGFGDENGSADKTTYPYVLHYYAKGFGEIEGLNGVSVSDECFVWDINVPVLADEPVQLTYTVHLKEAKSEVGEYGRYDADGSEKYDGLLTNKRATLYPVDSEGTQGTPEDFDRPTVSYTVPEPDTGSSGGSDPYYPPSSTEPSESAAEEVSVQDVAGAAVTPESFEVPEIDLSDKGIAGTRTGAATGDETPVGLWSALAAVAVVMIVFVLIGRGRASRKKKKACRK